MSGIGKLFRRSVNASLGKGFKTHAERQEARKARHQAGLDKMFASAKMPDEEEIKRSERRKAARRRGSRVETVLTDDTLG